MIRQREFFIVFAVVSRFLTCRRNLTDDSNIANESAADPRPAQNRDPRNDQLNSRTSLTQPSVISSSPTPQRLVPRPSSANESLVLSDTAQNRAPRDVIAPDHYDLDALCEKYKDTSGFSDLSCLIRLLNDPLWLEQETAKTLQELDSYGGGVGTTLQHLQEERAGNIVSIRSGCLVRMKPTSSGRDTTYISHHCAKCGKQHKWKLQRGALSAALIGRYGDNILDALLSGLEASHGCHNTMCSDPFHIDLESRAANIRRKSCVKQGKCSCGGAKQCRLDLT